MKSGVRHLLDVGRPVAPYELMEQIKARRMPVRVIRGGEARVVQIPISEWGTGDVAAMRQLVEALGFVVIQHAPWMDPDGCMFTVREPGHGK